MAAPRARALAALGWTMARSGPLATVSIGVGALTTLGMIVAAFVLSRHGGRALAQLPSVASSALAWGAGILLAFSSSAHALRRDREQGIRALVRARGGSAASYLWGRVAGLFLVLALVVVGGTMLTGVAATALASKGAWLKVARGSAASIVYALSFALVVAPVALAALGARSRAGGYVALVMILVVPQLFAGWTEELLPRGWEELTSIPAILTAVRGSIVAFDGARLARALLAVAIVTIAATAIVRQQMARVDAEVSR
jgi:hypothetical protein